MHECNVNDDTRSECELSRDHPSATTGSRVESVGHTSLRRCRNWALQSKRLDWESNWSKAIDSSLGRHRLGIFHQHRQSIENLPKPDQLGIKRIQLSQDTDRVLQVWRAQVSVHQVQECSPRVATLQDTKELQRAIDEEQVTYAGWPDGSPWDAHTCHWNYEPCKGAIQDLGTAQESAQKVHLQHKDDLLPGKPSLLPCKWPARHEIDWDRQFCSKEIKVQSKPDH